MSLGPLLNENGSDYSYARPPIPELAKAGGFVMRYLSQDPAKNLTPEELASLHAAGLAVGLVWEDRTGIEPLGGALRGEVDGKYAASLLRTLNWPANVAVFWAFDADDRAYDGWGGPMTAYDYAFAQAISRPAWPYGSNRMIDTFGGGWQTQAWSDGAVSPHAFLLQYANGAVVPGTDRDVALQIPEHWLYFPSNIPLPGVIPDMQTVDFNAEQNMDAPTIRTIRYLMTARGVWYDPSKADGATVREAFKQFQTLAKLKVDGICGPTSWAVLSSQLAINGAVH